MAFLWDDVIDEISWGSISMVKLDEIDEHFRDAHARTWVKVIVITLSLSRHPK